MCLKKKLICSYRICFWIYIFWWDFQTIFNWMCSYLDICLNSFVSCVKVWLCLNLKNCKFFYSWQVRAPTSRTTASPIGLPKHSSDQPESPEFKSSFQSAKHEFKIPTAGRRAATEHQVQRLHGGCRCEARWHVVSTWRHDSATTSQSNGTAARPEGLAVRIKTGSLETLCNCNARFVVVLYF